MWLLVGTAKGLFRFRSADRQAWESLGPALAGDPVYVSAYDPASGTLYAGVNSSFYGPSVRRSWDVGETWDAGGRGLQYAADDPETVTRVWSIRPVGDGVVYAGVEASGLFRSLDGGDSWEEMRSLRRHPTHATWQPGFGGKCLHTIACDPFEPNRLYVACSTGGVYRSDDRGAEWTPANAGIVADFMPPGEQYPVSGQCVHKIALSAARPGRIWLQNHGGVYRSDDAGATWNTVGASLPSDFGFPIVADRQDADRAWVIPLTPHGRWYPDRTPAVYTTADGGLHWERLHDGLPATAYDGVLRDAFAVDDESKPGLYFGTTAGSVYASADAGRHWRIVAERLPRIYGVTAVSVP